MLYLFTDTRRKQTKNNFLQKFVMKNQSCKYDFAGVVLKNMIKKFSDNDIDHVMTIWFESNMDSHDFINPDYWKEKCNEVRSMIPQAEVYVYETDSIIKGFIGLDGDYIAGIFVDKLYRSEGIGTALIDFAKKIRNRLVLSVYEKNKPAVKFYEKSGFIIESTGTDNDTLQIEYTMLWNIE